MAVPVIFLAGSGYEYSRASKLRTKLLAAVDGTALTLCQMPATARCAPPYPTVFEIALVLDTTGSMNGSDGTATKLASAKRAAK